MFPMTPAGQPTGQPMVAPLPGLPSKQVPPPRPTPTWLIILVFCLFAGLIAETFLTASTSPMDAVRHPFSVPFNVVLYGTFDLLAREILVRRRAGLASALLLGAAYGFVNEGVAAGTWYVIHPQGYAFIGRVDWVWALALTLFHAIISVLTPIAFLEILFPATRGQPLLRRWGMVSCVVLFFGCVFFAIAVLAPLPLLLFAYRMTVLAVAVLFALVAVALPSRQAPHPASTPLPNPSASAAAPPAPPPPSPPARRLPGLPGLWRLRIVGFLAMFTFFLLTMLFPVLVAALLHARPGGLLIAQGIDCAAFLAFSALVIWRGWTWSQRAGWSPRQNLALLLGGVTFTTLLLNLTEAPMGEIFSTLPFYALLIALTLRWRRRTSAPRAAK